ncbi:hypothetical protein [Halopseudomonas phragmitis]|uniref:hypothetical protein n=1 Tax=Halopseudomonas phragmitis TaxID=1931241 RepID=UPI0015A7445C|nr:hypothetical protein [Halopseudomonas phragmitis]
MTEMAANGDAVTVVQACRWSGISRRSYYYRPTKAKPRINEHLAERNGRAADPNGKRAVPLAA